MNISIVIITKNEEDNIARCIRSCEPLNAEIIVLDSESSDNTPQIAEELGAKVYTVRWRGYGATKNLGTEKAQNNWILSLDADEALDNELAQNILDIDWTDNNTSAFYLERKLVFEGKQLSFGAVKDEKRLRLYRKDKMKWNDRKVHEELETIHAEEKPSFKNIAGNLLHYSYKDVKDMRKRLEKYALLGAEQLKHKSNLYLLLKKLFAPGFSFIKNYYFRKGYADGKEGRLFALEQANYVRKKYAYALKHKSI